MTSHSPLKKFLLLLSAIAVLAVQILGVVRGYACDCGGGTQVVAADSCVGPHGKSCHSGDKPSQESSDSQQDGSRKQHDTVTEDFKLTSVSAPPIVIADPVVLAILPDFFLCELQRSNFPLKDMSDTNGHPPLSVTVAQTVVLRL